MSSSSGAGGPRGIWRSTVTRSVLLLALTGLIAVDIASGDHAPTRLAGVTGLCVVWLINAWGLVRRLRRRP